MIAVPLEGALANGYYNYNYNYNYNVHTHLARSLVRKCWESLELGVPHWRNQLTIVTNQGLKNNYANLC